MARNPTSLRGSISPPLLLTGALAEGAYVGRNAWLRLFVLRTTGAYSIFTIWPVRNLGVDLVPIIINVVLITAMYYVVAAKLGLGVGEQLYSIARLSLRLILNPLWLVPIIILLVYAFLKPAAELPLQIILSAVVLKASCRRMLNEPVATAPSWILAAYILLFTQSLAVDSLIGVAAWLMHPTVQWVIGGFGLFDGLTIIPLLTTSLLLLLYSIMVARNVD